jgi:phosphate transport system substrate-binding protein
MRYLVVLLRCSPVALVCIVILAGCGGDPADSHVQTPTDEGQQVLTIFGPVGSRGALEALQVVFANSALPYEFQVFEGASAAPGVQGVLDGKFDLMVLMRRPQPDLPLTYIEFMRTPVVFFVNPSAGIHDLTSVQVAAIFSGDVTNWSELGGTDQTIVVLVMPEEDTNTQAVREHIMERKPFTDSARTLISDADVLTIVDGMPGTIGYTSWAAKKYTEFVSSNEYSTDIKLDGVSPDEPAYPLVSEVGVAFRPDRESFLEPLFDWGDKFLASEPVQFLIERFGLVSIDKPARRD